MKGGSCMIFVTGDTHGSIDVHKLNHRNFNYDGMTRNDYIIIAGDFGFIWYGKKTVYLQK